MYSSPPRILVLKLSHLFVFIKISETKCSIFFALDTDCQIIDNRNKKTVLYISCCGTQNASESCTLSNSCLKTFSSVYCFY